MLAPLPPATGVIDPAIDSAVVVNVSGALGGAGEVAPLFAASVELTRKKYVVFGSRLVSEIECTVTIAELDALCVSEPDEVP